MKTLAALAVAAALVSIPQVALASNLSSYVASSGADANPCTRAQPCQTLQRANDVTSGGGVITVVDAGDYGSVTISKSISIVASAFPTGVFLGGGFVNAPNIIITDVVLLRGLNIDGIRGGAISVGAITFNTGSKLLIHDCIIQNWTEGAVSAQSSLRPAAQATLS